MQRNIDRRAFLRLAGYGGVAFASALGRASTARPDEASAESDFYFVQLSDTHWGFRGAPNPDAEGTLPKAIAAVNALPQPPDFVVFTGDLTQLTLDAAERRRRMAGFREVAARLSVRDVRFLPGEHDASADRGEAYREYFGATHYSFDHKGVHFVALDNVSDPQGIVGGEQLGWLEADLKPVPKSTPIVVLAHRPLFDLAPEWGWSTGDGARVIDLLRPFQRVSVFYGHIHQQHHRMTGGIAHHAASSLIFPLPAPGSGGDHKPLPWDPARPYRGLGWRQVETGPGRADAFIEERSLAGS